MPNSSRARFRACVACLSEIMSLNLIPSSCMYVRVVIARLTQVVMSLPLRRPLASFSISRGIQNEIFGTLTAGTRAQTFNAGVTIKIRPDQSRGGLAKRIMPEVDVKLLIRAARSRRDRVMLETLLLGCCSYLAQRWD